MVSALSIATSGMNAAQLGLQASAHNIANLSTDGFRREQVVHGGGLALLLPQAAQSRGLGCG